MSTKHSRTGTGIPRPYRWLSTPVTAIAFYGAIALPAVYLPLLVAGIETTDGLVTFLGLLGLHLAALVGGRSYQDV